MSSHQQVWGLLLGETAPVGTGEWLKHLTPDHPGSDTEGLLVTAWHSQPGIPSLAFPGTAAHTKLQILPQS